MRIHIPALDTDYVVYMATVAQLLTLNLKQYRPNEYLPMGDSSFAGNVMAR
jgi:hypothetical protein